MTWTVSDSDYAGNAADGPVQTETTGWTYETNGAPGAGGGITDGTAGQMVTVGTLRWC